MVLLSVYLSAFFAAVLLFKGAPFLPVFGICIDAAVVAVAERISITTLASIDCRDLLVVRPAHCAAFELIP